MTDTDITNVTKLPLPAPGGGVKDPTAALRQRRRRKRKAVTIPVTRPEIQKFENANEIKADVTVSKAATQPRLDAGNGAAMGRDERPARRHGVTLATVTAALALATVSAGFSITGMTAIFAGAFWPVIGMGVALELGKLSAVAALPTLHRGGVKMALIILITVLMGMSAIGAYGFLAKAHIEHAVAGQVRALAGRANVDARLALQASLVSDLDRRIGQIDATVEKATSKGRTAAAMALSESQRKTRGELVGQRLVEAKTLASLQVEKAQADGERARVEADLGPVRYLATLLGADRETAMRWFILVVACLLDPAAVLLLYAAASTRVSCNGER